MSMHSVVGDLVRKRELEADFSAMFDEESEFYSNMARMYGIDKAAEVMVKMAQVPVAPIVSSVPWGSALSTAAKFMAVSAGLGLAAKGIESGAKKGLNALTFNRDFNNTLEANPELKIDYKDPEKKQKMRMAFQTMRRFAPTMSKDPLVAGNVLRRMNTYEGTLDHQMVSDLIAAERGTLQTEAPGVLQESASSLSRGMLAGLGGAMIQAKDPLVEERALKEHLMRMEESAYKQKMRPEMERKLQADISKAEEYIADLKRRRETP